MTEYWLVPSKGRTHIKRDTRNFYYCGIYNFRSYEVFQGNRITKDMKMCKNCLRVQRSRSRG